MTEGDLRMIIDSKKYGGVCRCGKEHRMATDLCVIEEGALARFDEYLEKAGVTGPRCAVYDTNTYAIPALRRPKAAQEVVLKAEGLHADENSTAELESRLGSDIRVLIAVGTGSIHDTVRYVAAKKGLTFVSVPTAASCDAFCSTVAAMTWHGFKKTLPAKAPALVVADLDVISTAPRFLTLSGIGDMLGKFVALADWKIARAVTGEELCPVIYGIMKDAVDGIWANCRDILKGSVEAYESVTYGLLMSGLAMQLNVTSRPASGAEHHISHFIEVGPQILGTESGALHGEKVGVGTVLASAEYHRLAETEDISGCVIPYRPVPAERFMEVFGPKLCDACIEENANDCLAAVTPEKLAEKWPEIREIIAEIPSSEEIFGCLEDLGAKRTLPDIEVDAGALPVLLDCSPLMRNRLTLMRMRRMLKHS